MADPIISPDGKFMWTGTEWIPAPPSGKPESQNHDITNAEILGKISQSSEGGDNNNQKINLQDVNVHKGVKQTTISEGASSQELKVSDTVIMGDLTQNTTIIEQDPTNASSAINLKDSVISGDINISQNVQVNSIRDIVSALKEIGITKKSYGKSMDSETEKAAVEIVSHLSDYNHEITSLSIEEAMSIVSASSLAGDFQSSKSILNEILNGNIRSNETSDFVFAKACLGEIELMLGNMEAANKILFSTLQEAKELNDSFLIVYSTLPVMRLMMTSGEFEQALEVGQNALDLSIRENDFDSQASLLNSLGAIYHVQGNLELANQCFEKSLKLMLIHKNIDLDPVIYRNLGLIAYDFEDDIDKSVNLLSKAYQLYSSNSNELGMIDVNNSLGRIFLEQGDAENGFAKFAMAYELGKQIGVIELIATCSMNLGTCCLRQNNFDLAERYYREAIDEFRKLDHFNLISAHFSLGELEKGKNNLLMAKTHFSNALEEANRRNASQLESEILVELAMIAEQQNNLSEQRMYNERAVEIWIQNEQPIPQWYIDNGY
ncbi:MAG: tetratricopeptide repeat protein [Candidatus Poseidoniales archaeon]|nr:tetratricopeptide repeat protein [Candidatus Poseidoniales archaeon]